ncbi:hypothetical protein NDU88_000157 [Pleurodeles waltl]|uniref:Uncharacterized protein n=1 Tax=Pleurodeles waltl TaxID=8319 RepID=A0AAV7USL1_PLEWA|nr:hypothetical protein NDU88_000157 [Pleurodeles waltl]
MCGPVTTRDGSEPLRSVEGRKAADAGFGHWNRAALELGRTPGMSSRLPKLMEVLMRGKQEVSYLPLRSTVMKSLLFRK